MFEAETKTSGF